jgi:site-specific recombinase
MATPKTGMPMKRPLESILNGFADPRRDPHCDPLALLVELVDRLRPRRADDREAAAQGLRALIHLLQQQPAFRDGLAAALGGLLERTRHVSLYVATGIFPPTGFFSETARRIGCSLLPEVLDRSQLKDVLGLVFHRPDDEQWVGAVDDEVWLELLQTLFTDAAAPADTLPGPLAQLVDALRVLSYHVSSIGLDPELVRVLASLEDYDSPFLAQNVEMLAHLERFTRAWSAGDGPEEDDRHLRVLLHQCQEVMLRIRRRASQEGTSLSLTFKMERLGQNLRRIDRLLRVLEEFHAPAGEGALLAEVVPLFKQLVRGECRKNHLGYYVQRNIELLSLRVTENAGRAGEHYITETRQEYFELVRSAMGAGLIIAVMAGFKLMIGKQGLAPLNEALAVCLNYGLGFVLIHLLHFTVATKQPAMTANAIAASIDEAGGKTRDLHRLVDLIARTIRSQLGAIFGNVVVAVPVAILIALGVHALGGAHYLDAAKSEYLLESVHPLSGAVIYAGIAGVCLFLSGLVAGYYDNLAAYDRIPERLLQLRWARRLLGEARLRRMADYVGDNLGALAGNLLFGFMLGGVSALGVLFGLPLDIRHIAFASAHTGYAIASLDFTVAWQGVAVAALGVGLIGLVNLVVSFALALMVALRARQVSFAQGRALVSLVLQGLATRPAAFLWPPREPATALEKAGS